MLSLDGAKTCFLIAALLAATLVGAWGFQLLGDLAPCPLCLQQRWPYYGGVVLALILGWRARLGPYEASVKAGLVVLILLLAVSALFGAYHSGVEWGWWTGPSDCAGAKAITTDASDLLAQIQRTRVVACNEAAFRFLGLSLAGYNALISAGLCALAVRALFAHGSSSVSQ